MFFLLSKILYLFVTPLFWILTLWLLFVWKRKTKHRKKLLISAITISVIFSNTFIFKEFTRRWEVPGTRIENLAYHETAIVLGGMFEYNNDLDVLSVRRGGDRIWQTLSLYHRGKIKYILISGAHGFVTDRGLDEARQLRDELVVWGIPKEHILIDSISKNTHENAVESVKVLKNKKLMDKPVLLVTSATHMKRAWACFDKAGLKTTPYSTDHFTGKKRAYHWEEYIMPSVSTTNDWSRLTKEWVGYLMYRIMGYC
jgi:uncharacterized SAM-binding protein YcdF (DUF218 family)